MAWRGMTWHGMLYYVSGPDSSVDKELDLRSGGWEFDSHCWAGYG